MDKLLAVIVEYIETSEFSLGKVIEHFLCKKKEEIKPFDWTMIICEFRNKANNICIEMQWPEYGVAAIRVRILLLSLQSIFVVWLIFLRCKIQKNMCDTIFYSPFLPFSPLNISFLPGERSFFFLPISILKWF